MQKWALAVIIGILTAALYACEGSNFSAGGDGTLDINGGSNNPSNTLLNCGNGKSTPCNVCVKTNSVGCLCQRLISTQLNTYSCPIAVPELVTPICFRDYDLANAYTACLAWTCNPGSNLTTPPEDVIEFFNDYANQCQLDNRNPFERPSNCATDGFWSCSLGVRF
jgi:hypothetical protein